jgi:hypothetical protein
MMYPHVCRFAAALPARGAARLPWGGLAEAP